MKKNYKTKLTKTEKKFTEKETQKKYVSKIVEGKRIIIKKKNHNRRRRRRRKKQIAKFMAFNAWNIFMCHNSELTLINYNL